MAKTEFLVRTEGGLIEDLEGIGPTTRGEAFEVDGELAGRLVKDGTKRFRKANAAESGKAQAKQRAVIEARKKAAESPPEPAKPGGGDE